MNHNSLIVVTISKGLRQGYGEHSWLDYKGVRLQSVLPIVCPKSEFSTEYSVDRGRYMYDRQG